MRSLAQGSALFAVLAVTGCGASAPSESQSADVPTDVRINLERDYDVTLDTEPRERVRVGAERAIRAASGFGFEGHASAHLVRYTDPDDCEYASELDAGQPETAQCTPLSVNRLAWLVVLRGVEAPIFGPAGRGGPGTYDATVAAFVDARSGREITAVTLPPG
jgi:hypothetical protein